MSSTPKDEDLKEQIVEGLRSVRGRARENPDEPPVLPEYSVPQPQGHVPSPPSAEPADAAPLRSPDRDVLNAGWDVSQALAEPPRGRWSRWLSPLRGPLQRLVRFALGPLVERQVQMNSAQVRFDNELIQYLDQRLDRMSRHYDSVLGLHGKRMEEIDERHSILQQELIRHVHDLVERIEFVFESAEQNHLYLEGMLREVKEELERLVGRLEPPPNDGAGRPR